MGCHVYGLFLRGRSEAEVVFSFLSFHFFFYFGIKLSQRIAKGFEMYTLPQENLIDQFKLSFKLQPNIILVLKGQESCPSLINV